MKVLTVDYTSDTAPADFARSLRETGFAVLTHHPVSFDLIMETYHDWEKFFASEEKMKYKFDPKLQSGYFPFRTEKAKDSEVKDLKEFFHVYPTTNLPTMLGESSWKLNHALTALASTLLGWVDQNTEEGIRKKFSMPLSEMIKDSNQILFRILHYPPLTGSEEQGAIRAAAHEDINLITLLP
jgi:isopenicillin N synthase-like dioxygenase